MRISSSVTQDGVGVLVVKKDFYSCGLGILASEFK